MNNNENNNIDNTNFLHRERENIVNATIEANMSVDKNSVETVNNTIIVKKKNKTAIVFVGFTLILAIILITFFATKLLFESESTTTTVPTPTTIRKNVLASYLTNGTSLRKFQNKNTILILLPIINSQKRCLYLKTGDYGILKQESGTYNIESNSIGLELDYELHQINILDTTLEDNNVELPIYDHGIKYYMSQDKILIMNGTVNNEFAYYFDGEEGNFYDFTENNETIILNNTIIFTKNGEYLDYDGILFSYVN